MDGDAKAATGRGSGAVERAYRAVQEGIATGLYQPREHLTEEQVARAAGVSRTPAREALRRLHAEGVVDVRPHLGAVVTPAGADDVEEIFALRALLEAHGAARAARRIVRPEAEALVELAALQVHEARTRTAGYLERMVAMNTEFHRRICDAAASPRLSRALDSILDATSMPATFARYTLDELIRSASHHEEIARALLAGDPDWAAASMRAHVLSAKKLQER